MIIPKVDFNNLAINMLAWRQRKTKWIITAKALASPIVRLYGLFVGFKDGETLSTYNSGTTYVINARVKFNFKTYESLIAGNTGNQPDTNPTAWLLRNNSFIGATERARYNGFYLPLTYALNRQFGTTFSQPPYPAPYDFGLGAGTFSGIYITNLDPVYVSFVSFTTETLSSGTYTTGSGNTASFSTEVYATASSYMFAVHVPVGVYNALGSTNAIRNSIISKFVNQYLISGTGFTIQTY